jgi:dGTPase
MQWSNLLSAERLGRSDAAIDEFRSPFQRDYDRIVFTTAFRRLQDKTQVFPLSSSDFVRTRLTHSIEVSCVARNLGTIIGRKLRKENLLPKIGVRSSDFGNIVAAASLAHDLGNPPFGHSGEAAIQHWFKTSMLAQRVADKFTEQQRLEFEKYEGNAHAFRLVTRLLSPTTKGGLQLTYATLATLVKYPIVAHKNAVEFEGKVSAKKHNFFGAEATRFEEVANAVQLVRRPGEIKWWCRHPLAFVCEAADDITNRVVDFEDGYRLKCISAGKTIRALTSVLTDSRRKRAAEKITLEKEKVNYLRAVVISQLVEEAADVFVAKHDDILSGAFEDSLFDHLPSAPMLRPIKNITIESVYTDPRVLGVETAGFEIIYQLLERFTGAAMDALESRKKDKNPSIRSEKILGLLPSQYSLLHNKTPIAKPYHLLLSMTDFVAGMTDSYAVDTFQRITGQKFVT